MVNWDNKRENQKRDRFNSQSPVRDHEKRQNNILDKKIGGRTVKGSGCTNSYKGDRDLGDCFKLEQKATDKSSMVLKVSWFEKIHKEARDVGKEPGVIFSFLKHKGTCSTDWMVIPIELFRRMYDFCTENDFEF